MALIGVIRSGPQILLQLGALPFLFLQLLLHQVEGDFFDGAATAAGPESFKKNKNSSFKTRKLLQQREINLKNQNIICINKCRTNIF